MPTRRDDMTDLVSVFPKETFSVYSSQWGRDLCNDEEVENEISNGRAMHLTAYPHSSKYPKNTFILTETGHYLMAAGKYVILRTNNAKVVIHDCTKNTLVPTDTGLSERQKIMAMGIIATRPCLPALSNQAITPQQLMEPRRSFPAYSGDRWPQASYGPMDVQSDSPRQEKGTQPWPSPGNTQSPQASMDARAEPLEQPQRSIPPFPAAATGGAQWPATLVMLNVAAVVVAVLLAMIIMRPAPPSTGIVVPNNAVGFVDKGPQNELMERMFDVLQDMKHEYTDMKTRIAKHDSLHVEVGSKVSEFGNALVELKTAFVDLTSRVDTIETNHTHTAYGSTLSSLFTLQGLLVTLFAVMIGLRILQCVLVTLVDIKKNKETARRGKGGYAAATSCTRR